MRISIFDLPHILESISDTLSGEDIQSCALVCHDWSLVFRPLYWRAFTLNSADYSCLLTLPKPLALFNKRAHTIRELTIHAHRSQRFFEPYLWERPDLLSNQLTHLYLIGGPDSTYWSRNPHGQNQESFDLLLILIDRNLNSLVHVEISIPLNPYNFARSLKSRLPEMRSLKTLILKGGEGRDGKLPTSTDHYSVWAGISLRDLCLILGKYPSQLETLRIDYTLASSTSVTPNVMHWGILESPRTTNNDALDSWYSSEDDNPESDRCLLREYWNTTRQSNLRTLSLPKRNRASANLSSCGFLEGRIPVLLGFLAARCEKLESLVLPWMENGTDPDELSRVLERCPSLRHLEFEGVHRKMLDLYPRAIQACRQLESLTVSGRVCDARGIMDAIVSTQTTNLKTIRWLGNGGYTGGLDLEVFLRNCNNLERLETTCRSEGGYLEQRASGGLWIRDEPLLLTTLTTSLSEALSSVSISSSSTAFSLPYACQETLTYLNVTFYIDEAVTDEERFKCQIEHTYRKLGQLRNLEELHLGCDCRCVGPQLQDCEHFVRWDRQYGESELEDPPVEEALKKEDDNTPVAATAVLDGDVPDTHPPVDEASKEQDNDTSAAATAIFPGVDISNRVDIGVDSTKLLAPVVQKGGAPLDMTLASGLGHLSELKRLRLFNVTRIKGHRIGLAELEWMQEHWPQLEELRGIRNTKLCKWLKRHWPGLSLSWQDAPITK